MISGTEFWDKSIKREMTIKKFNQKPHETYKDLNSNMYQVLKENTTVLPDKVGVVDTNNTAYTYRQMLDMTNKLSYYLSQKYQVKRSMHIGLLLYNSIEFIITFLAAQKIGATIIPFPTKYREPEIDALIEKSNCDLLVIDEKYSSWVRKYDNPTCRVMICESKTTKNKYAFQYLDEYPEGEIKENGSIEDKAVIMFTSGTTSFSKGAIIRNFNLQHAVVSYSRILDVDEKDSTILSIPIYNVTGLIATLSLFLKCKGTVYVHQFFNVEKLLSDFKRLDITFFHASPTIFTLMLKEKTSFPELPSLKTFACGSSNMPAEKIKELKSWLPNMLFKTIYGLTETASPATIFPSDASVSTYIGSSGQPIPGLSIKVVDDSGEEVKIESVGEIWLKGTNVIEEYYQLQSDLITKDGWLKTGDIGYVNKEGYLYIADRKKDLINRGGEKIFCIDIENAISQIDGVNEVAVIGVKDDLYGEVPLAIITVKEGYSINKSILQSNLKTKLATFKIPAHYRIVDDILKTANGKIDKKAIRSLIEKGVCLNEC